MTYALLGKMLAEHAGGALRRTVAESPWTLSYAYYLVQLGCVPES